jgi:DNA-binding transcriptional MocR family regulator
MATTRPGDAVAVESPVYYGILQLFEALRLRAVEIPSDPRDGASVPALARVLERKLAKVVLLNPTYNNPLGSLVPEPAKREIALLAARHGVPVIEDDLYGDLGHEPGERPRTIQSFDEAGLVILCSSFSKTLSPGARVGWIAAGRFEAAVERLKVVTTLATPTLPQLAVAELLADGGYDRHLRRVKRAYAQQLVALRRAVLEHFPDGTRVTCPSGGFVLWVALPGGIDAHALAERARSSGISIAPGPLFSPRGGLENHVRLNGALWDPVVEAAVAKLGALAREGTARGGLATRPPGKFS